MFHIHVKRRNPVCTCPLASLKVIILIWFSQTPGKAFSTCCNLFKTSIIPTWAMSEKEKLILNCNQIKKEPGRIWVWIFNFLIQICIASLLLCCITQVTIYFLQKKVFFQKLKPVSLGNNNMTPAPSGGEVCFLFSFFPYSENLLLYLMPWFNKREFLIAPTKTILLLDSTHSAW